MNNILKKSKKKNKLIILNEQQTFDYCQLIDLNFL